VFCGAKHIGPRVETHSDQEISLGYSPVRTDCSPLHRFEILARRAAQKCTSGFAPIAVMLYVGHHLGLETGDR
jgi:hypothetical protein